MKSSIPIPIYKGTLHICIGNVAKQAKKHFRVTYEDGANECSAITTQIDFLNFLMIFTKPMVGNYATAAHEAKHFVNYVFKNRGVQLCTSNDEAECYFLGWAVSQIQTVFESYLSDKAAKKAKRNKVK